MRRILAITTLATLALGGCATVPAPIAGTDFSPVTPQQAVAQNGAATRVRWGGEIIKVEPKNDSTCFEVLSRDLYPDARPNRHDGSDGRFIACTKGFFDPAVYTKGRDLTVVGRVSGTEQHQVGDYNYTYAHVDADNVYLWPRRQYADGYYDPWWPYYDPIWGSYPGWWVSPVIVVHAHHH
ncbi:MAG TPA: Slp family lipoprotein [Rudaea sp.]|nr:Slp family lipoprotein [Rudaea sp.]